MAIKQFIRITAKPKGGFRRAGIHHPSEPVDHLADELEERLTADQIKALLEEPNLICVPIERDDDEEEGEGEPDPATKSNNSNPRRQSGNRRSGGKGKS